MSPFLISVEFYSFLNQFFEKKSFWYVLTAENTLLVLKYVRNSSYIKELNTFQKPAIWFSRIHSYKYQRFTPSVSNDIGIIRKL